MLSDQRMMNRALALARWGQGWVEPNPMVGCVIVHDGRVGGEGFHRRFGGPHAEIEALRGCGGCARGATVYVTLEPCCHHGKTPPCTEALIAAKVGRVVFPFCDPSPQVRGRGMRALRKAGIEVTTGVMAAEAAEVLAPFLTRQTLGRPYVIAKWAQSLDGKLATRTGDSKWISNEKSRRLTHRLRARVDAILVGAGTVLADNPILTARAVPVRRLARRVVLDARLRIPEECQLVVTARQAPTLVVTDVRRAGSRKAARLQKCGAEIVPCGSTKGGLDLGLLLKLLARRSVTNLLVEGGPKVLTTFFEAGLVDEAWVFVAPTLIGGSAAPSVMNGFGARDIASAIKPRVMEIRRLHDDTFFRLRFSNAG